MTSADLRRHVIGGLLGADDFEECLPFLWVADMTRQQFKKLP